MHRRNKTTYIFLLVLLIGFFLSACNSGTDQKKSKYTVSGTAPGGASVTVSNEQGAVVASGKASANGFFEFEVELYRPEMLSLSSSSGVKQLTSEQSVAFSENDRFYAFLPYAPKATNFANIDGPNTVAHSLATYYRANGAKSYNEAYRKAYDAVSGWLGFSIDSVSSNKQIAIQGGSDFPAAHTLDQAILDWCERMKSWNGQIANTCSIANLYRLAAKDIVNDGVINGASVSGPLELGGAIFNASIFKKSLPLEVLRRAEKPDYKYDRTSANSFAEKLIAVESQMLSGEGNLSVDKKSPYIEISGLDETAKNIHKITYDVFDYSGVKYLEANIGGKVRSLTPEPGLINLDTREYANGSMQISFVATSEIGIRSESTGVINIQNKSETIFGLTAGNGGVQSSVIQLSSTIGLDQGVSEVRFSVDSNLVKSFGATSGSNSRKDYAFNFDTGSINDGSHTFLVEVETALGNTYRKSASFITKNKGPDINWPLPLKDENKFPNVPIYSAKETISFSVVDAYPVQRVEIYWGDSPKPLHTFDAGGDEGQSEYRYNLSLNIDTRTLFEARHKITVKALGASGLWSTEEREVLVDWSRPLVNYLEPGGKILRGAGPHFIRFSATDTNAMKSSPILATIKNPDNDSWSDSISVTYDPSNGKGQIEINPPVNDGGARELELTVTDAAGKASKAKMSLIYGNVMPFVVSTWSEERRSGVQEKIIYYAKIRDVFAVSDAETDDLSIDTDDKALDLIESVSVRDGSGDFVVKMDEYTKGYRECGFNKNVKKYRFESKVTYQNDIGMTFNFIFSSMEGVTTNLPRGIIGVARRRDCR